jgi:hypothetical protein
MPGGQGAGSEATIGATWIGCVVVAVGVVASVFVNDCVSTGGDGSAATIGATATTCVVGVGDVASVRESDCVSEIGAVGVDVGSGAVKLDVGAGAGAVDIVESEMPLDVEKSPMAPMPLFAARARRRFVGPKPATIT